jgi:type IV secretion system protein VirB10
MRFLAAGLLVTVAWAQEGSSVYQVETGTRIPLTLINSISTRQAAEGDRIYLETAFPILSEGKIVIPPGSYVAGTVTQVKRAGRVKGRAELYVRFDSLTLPNGVTRDFRARIGSLDGLQKEKLDRGEGTVTGESDKGGDARVIGETAAAGTTIGAIAGSTAGRAGMGAGIGAAAGAAAGLVGVLMGRGPDAILARGSTIEMVLDRPLRFSEDELSTTPASRRISPANTLAPPPAEERRSLPLPGRGLPF